MTERPTGPVRVMLVEDNAAVRRAVADLLNASGDLQVCGEAATVAEAGAAAEASHPDVVIVDLRLPDGSGVEAGRQVRSCLPGVRVMLLTSASEEEALVASILAGASAYVVKQVLGGDLVGTVRAVAKGETLFDRSAGAAALHLLGGQTTLEESRILALVAQDRTDREIGQDLGLEEATVKDRVTSLTSRLADRRRRAPLSPRRLPSASAV